MGTGAESRISWLAWLRHGPFLAQLVVTRRCNLSCGYCTEYDATSAPVPFGHLQERLEKLRALRAWAVSLMGGEPTLHPDLMRIVGEMRRLGFRRRMMTTNALRLTRESIEGLNREGLTDVSVSVDGVRRNATTLKVLETLRKPLALLREHARFRVTLSAVVGSAPTEEAIEVVRYARDHGFAPRVLWLHDERGQFRLSADERRGHDEVERAIGRPAREGHGYRDRLIESGRAPFRCRAGARYLYVDELGFVRWCAQTRAGFGRPLAEYTARDLRQQFYTAKSCSDRCCVGCARTVSALDEWRRQDAAGATTPLPVV
jgi:MoaA/NifB/PqqE/SkfB family radical SAM enzyme